MDEQAYIRNIFGVVCSPGEASSLLDFREWFEGIAEFDRVSGEPLDSNMDQLCENIKRSAFDINNIGNIDIGTKKERRSLRDRLYRVCDYTGDSLRAITGRLRVSIRREHTVLPIYAARELDSASLLWLSRRPGRNVREKLAGKHAILAVKRHQSIDTLENRLLKTFIKRLTEKLEKRAEYFAPEDEHCTAMLVFLRRWLGSEDAKEIGAWRNEPPNNTLLHDKHYHKIWRAWKTFQTIDEKTREDIDGLAEARLTVIFWTLLTELKSCDECRIIQQPVKIDYDGMRLTPALTTSGISRNRGVWNAKLDAASRKLVFEFPEIGATHMLQNSAGKLLLNKRPVRGSLKDAVSFLAKCLFNVKTDKTIEAKASEANKTVSEASFGHSEAEYACVDICSVHPAYFIQRKSQEHFPFRMFRQEWEKHGTIDCGDSSAVMLHDTQEEIETIGLRNVFFDEPQAPAVLNAASFFMEKIKGHLDKESGRNNESCVLHYIVPDWISELSLTSINRIIHYSFKNAFPLPRSIAAIGAWQSSKYFPYKEVLVLAIDVMGKEMEKGISVTPIESVFNEELARAVPRTGGWGWERNPTFILPLSGDKTIRNFQNEGYDPDCAIELLRLFGADGLKREKDNISFLYDDQWNHISQDIKKIFDPKIIVLDNLLDKIKSLKINEKNYPVVILPLQDELQIDKKSGVIWHDSELPLTEGAAAAAEWQKQAGEIPFWRDHLPELSADFGQKRRYLVRNITAIPMRGSKRTWELDFTFKLDGGQTYYQFPLYQGEGEQTARFEAYLKPSVPLVKDMRCKLEMTYTYGEDMPYVLRFIPLPEERAAFEFLEVIWQRLDEDAILDRLESPMFPPCKSWKEMEELNWLKDCISVLEHLIEQNLDPSEITEKIVEKEIKRDIEWRTEKRQTGTILWDATKNDKYYCLVAVDNDESRQVICHSDRFIEKPVGRLSEGSFVYFDLFEKETDGEKKLQSENITFSDIMPDILKDKIIAKAKTRVEEHINEKLDFYYERIQKQQMPKARALLLKIWNGGHSLSEPDVPDEFRMAMFKMVQDMETIYRNENIPFKIRNQIFFLFCCLHRDVPGELLMERFDQCFLRANDMRRNLRNIGLAIGDGGLKWQDDLLQSVLGLISKDKESKSNAFEILAVALWRTERLFSKIPSKDLKPLVKKLCECLKDDKDIPIDRLKADDSFALQRLCRHLEVLLALLRTRKSEDKDVKWIFMPGKEFSSDFIKLLDSLDTLLTDNNIRMKSRIDIHVEIPEEYQATNPLIYILRLYLSGKSKEQHITILDVSDDDSQ